ncbi:MAG: hypothetical protein JWQ02_4464 [Capsulimonas sp.]|nr:hypothetical protein [Capsulimonas sp.]
MLRITVEIVPGSEPSRRRTLATMAIANISALAATSDYELSASEGANPLASTAARTCQAVLTGHDRRQSVWAIVAAASSAVLEEKVDWVDW